MEKNWESEEDKILTDAGIYDKDMTPEEKKKLVKTLRQSEKDYYGGSPLSKSQKDLYGGSPVSKSQEDNGSVIKEEKLSMLNDLQTGNAIGEEVLDHNSSNLGNTSQPLSEKEVPKEVPPKREVCYSAAAARSPSGKPGLTITFKSAPGEPVAVRNFERDPNSPYQASASLSNDGVWLDAGTNRENSTKRSTSISKEETKPEETTPRETENTSTKDSVNTLHGESKDRESPENLEVPRLNALVFKNRIPSSFFLELASLPSLNSLSREEWVHTACQNLFARKVAQMEKNCGSRWVTLLERSISIASLENAVAKASPQRSKDDDSRNFSDSIPITKASSSPENIFNDVREGSPDVVVVDGSPESRSVNSEGHDSAAIAPSESTKNQDKVETPVSSPARRSDNHGNHGGGDGETGRRKNARNRARKAKGGSKSNTSNDDISNGAPSASVVRKDSDRDVTASTSNYSPMGGNSPANNSTEDKQKCPMCQRYFNLIGDLERHAWTCMGATAEGENQVAENSGRSDAAEPKRRKLFSSEDDDEELQIVDKMNSVFSRKSDGEEGDDNFVTKTAHSHIRKRHVVLSDDEDFPSKSPRK